MKKFISMVMAAAMVVSLVPATAFAYDVSSTAKILDVADLTEDEAKTAKAENKSISQILGADVPELQIKLTDDSYSANDTTPVEYEITLTLDNAEWKTATAAALKGLVKVAYDGGATVSPDVDVTDIDDDEATFTIKISDSNKVLREDDKVIFTLDTLVTKTSDGSKATVSVDSDDLGVTVDDLVFATVADYALKVTCKGIADVAEEETTTLDKDLKIETTTGKFKEGQILELKLNSGFEFVEKECYGNGDLKDGVAVVAPYTIDDDSDEKTLVLKLTAAAEGTDEITIKADNITIEAATAKEGAVAKITVKAKKNGTGTFADTAEAVEVAKVVGDGIVIEVDEDEDVPEMWSGVAADTKLLTDDDDNTSLEFTIKETVGGAYNEKDEVKLVLPEGVYVVGDDGVDVAIEEQGDGDAAGNDWEQLFYDAYQEGDHESFTFKRRTIKESDKDAFEINVKLELVADPDFVGDVDVELFVGGDSVGKVTIATFKAPLTVEAQQNDLIIDYRNTEVPTDIVVKEAEAGLWAEGLVIGFGIDRMTDEDDPKKDSPFEDDMVYTVNEDESGMEITGEDDYLAFEVDEESDDEAAVVTISNISLYMQRNLAAGPYDLTLWSNAITEYHEQVLFAPDCDDYNCDGDTTAACKKDNDCIVDDVCDYSDVVKEGFINIITAGRDQDDASFTKKVVVPVGEAYIVAGEETVKLDVPAYISAAGYTMLPVRAVAVALGINNNNVLWDSATKTVTILYGQRIITMVAGQKTVYVNGSAIPASASVEIKDGRTFLPMRDLATALGVTDITWDAATKTATLNGNK